MDAIVPAKQYDLIIVGLGAMGSAALYHASRRGIRALGIDRHDPPHTLGSTHGDTRVTRQSIGEGELYLPFVRRSDEIWRELEAQSGQRLFLQSGGLVIAPRDAAAKFHGGGDFVAGSARIAREHDIPHAMLSSGEVMQRLPLLKLRDCDHAYYEPNAGVLRPERCVQVQLDLARDMGAETLTNTVVGGFKADARGVTVSTDKGDIRCDKLILSAGAWMGDLLPADVRGSLKVYRQVFYWFAADDISAFYPERFPWLIWIGDRMQDFFSAFPAPRDGMPGVKVMTEEYYDSCHADTVRRAVNEAETRRMFHELTAPRLRGLRDELLHAQVCLYTVTPDEHFIIDRHPASDRVIVASPCSGHGFKHSPAIGECLVELALDGDCRLEVSPFRLSRLA